MLLRISHKSPGVSAIDKALSIDTIHRQIILSVDACDKFCRIGRDDDLKYGRYHSALCRYRHSHILFKYLTVSRSWFSVVVPVLWNTSIEFRELISLLFDKGWRRRVTYSHGQSEEPRFSRHRLERLFFYANLVKSLRMEPCYSYERYPSSIPIVLLEIKSLCKDRVLLPNLRILNIDDARDSWLYMDGGPSILSYLLRSDVQRLELGFRCESSGFAKPDLLAVYLTIVAKQVPNLLHFELMLPTMYNNPGCMKAFEPLAILFCLKMRSLQTITLPSSWISTKLLLSIARKSGLRELKLIDSYPKWEGTERKEEPPEDATPSSISDSGDSMNFTSLDKFEVTALTREVKRMILTVFPKDHRLKVLEVRLKDQPSFEIYSALAQAFPRIESLHLDAEKYPTDPVMTNPYSLFYPFARCVYLKTLSITDMTINLDDVKGVLRSAVELEVLVLTGRKCSDHLMHYGEVYNSRVMYDEFLGLVLNDLEGIATLAPKLRKLELTLQVSDEPVSEEIEHRFQCLESLTLISSFLNFRYCDFNAFDAGRYIRSVLNNPSAKFEFSEDGSLEEDEFVINYTRWCKYTERYRDFYYKLVNVVKTDLTGCVGHVIYGDSDSEESYCGRFCDTEENEEDEDNSDENYY